MTYTIKFVNFTLEAPFQKNRRRALPALYGSYAHVDGCSTGPQTGVSRCALPMISSRVGGPPAPRHRLTHNRGSLAGSLLLLLLLLLLLGLSHGCGMLLGTADAASY